MGIIHSPPHKWRLLLKILRANPFPFRSPPSTNRGSADIYVSLDGNSVVDIQQLTSKKVYESIIAVRAKEPSAKVKFIELFPDENLDWKAIYKIPFLATIDSKTRIFQFKILHRILFTNSNLFKMKLVPSPLCPFCGIESGSPEHIFCILERFLCMGQQYQLIFDKPF